MMTYNENGSPRKLYWNFLDNSKDGTIWNNPDYEKWFETYAGKETDTDRPQNYYPHKYRIESDWKPAYRCFSVPGIPYHKM